MELSGGETKYILVWPIVVEVCTIHSHIISFSIINNILQHIVSHLVFANHLQHAEHSDHWWQQRYASSSSYRNQGTQIL
jgi:hypothetical protein